MNKGDAEGQSVLRKKQGSGDISAAAIWIEAFRRKGKTHSTKNRPVLYFLTTFKAPFLCNKAERLSWTSVWSLYGKGVFGTTMLCVCACNAWLILKQCFFSKSFNKDGMRLMVNTNNYLQKVRIGKKIRWTVTDEKKLLCSARSLWIL